MTDNTFQLSGFALPGVERDPFGLWEVVPARHDVSFAVDEAAQPEEPLHRVNFASVDEGRALLQLKRRGLQEQENLLQQAERRLAQIAQTSGVSFAAPIDQLPEFAQPELNLEAALRRLTEPVSFGLFDRKKQAEQEGDREAMSQWRRFLEQVRELLVNYARVETAVASAPIGRTTVSWLGDFRTIWIPAVTLDDMTLHRHNVDVTLQWRRGTLRFVGVVSSGAANVAVKLGVPGGQLLALPAVWNFVKDVLAEWRKLQAIKRQ